MIAVVTLVVALIVFVAGMAAIVSGCTGEYRQRTASACPSTRTEADDDPTLVDEIEEWLRQQQ